jgi:hypothetical protein
MAEMQMTWEEQEVFRLLKKAPGTKYQEATETEQTLIRDWLRSLLHSSVVTVEFVKSDGSVRVMNCTLDLDRMPISTNGTIDGLARTRRETDVNVQTVFDVDLQQWRSFRYDRLQKITSEIRFDK